MTNTIPQGGSKPAGHRLAARVHLLMLQPQLLDFPGYPNNPCAPFGCPRLSEATALENSLAQSTLPLLTVPLGAALFHISISILTIQPLVCYRGSDPSLSRTPQQSCSPSYQESQAPPTTFYLREQQTNAGRLYTVFPIVQISASFIAIHITMLFTFSISFAGPGQTRRVVDVFSKECLLLSILQSILAQRPIVHQQKQPRMCIVYAFPEEEGGQWKEWAGVTYVRQSPLQQPQQPLPQLSRKGKSTSRSLTFPFLR